MRSGLNTVISSTNGTNWTGLGTTIFTVAGNAITYASSKWVAVGSGTNTIAYSTDGTTWTGLGTTLVDIGLNVINDGTRFIVTGSTSGTNNTILSSSNLTSWTGLGTAVFSSSGNAIVYKSSSGMTGSTGYYVAVGSGTNSIARSPDLSTWTGIGTSIFSSANCVIYDGSYYIAGGTGNNCIATSTDGISWTGIGSSIFGQTAQLYLTSDPIYSDNNSNIYSSNDMINWTQKSLSAYFATIRRVVSDGYSNYVAIGMDSSYNYKTAVSTDSGNTWTGLGTTVPGRYLSYVNNKMWYISGADGGFYYTQTNLLVWTRVIINYYNFQYYPIFIGNIQYINSEYIFPFLYDFILHQMELMLIKINQLLFI